MIVDRSAKIAAITGEPASARILGALATAERRAVGAPTLVETGIVLVARLGPAGRTVLVRFCDELEIDSLPFTDAHVPLAFDAFQRFGKGRHPASLTFGDCMTSATAAIAGEPLLCVGDDFSQTDLETVTFADT